MSKRQTELNREFDKCSKDNNGGVHVGLRMLRNGYVPTQTRVEHIVAWGGKATLDGMSHAYGNGFVPSVARMKQWVENGSNPRVYFADQLRWKRTVALAIEMKVFIPDKLFIDFCINQRTRAGDSALLAIVKYSDAKLTKKNLNDLLTHGTSESVNAVVAYIKKGHIPRAALNSLVDFWLAPAVVNGRNGKMYGDMLYTEPEDRGPLADYDRAVTAAIETGFVLNDDQIALIKTRTGVFEFFPANGGLPGLGRVSDCLTRALDLPRS